MADLTANDVTFTPFTAATAPKVNPRIIQGGPNPRIVASGVLSFGDGALTYPALGIPLNNIRCSMPVQIDMVTFPDPTDGGSGTLWTYDMVNQKLRGYSALGTEISGAIAATTLNAVITGF